MHGDWLGSGEDEEYLSQLWVSDTQNHKIELQVNLGGAVQFKSTAWESCQVG